MASRSIRIGALEIILISLPVVIGASVWSSLPSKMAIHFSATGVPDNYVPKTLGVLLLPLATIATLLFLKAAMRYDPPDNPQTAPFISISTLLLMASVQCFLIGWNLGYTLPPEIVLIGALIWGVILTSGTVFLEYHDN